MQDLKNYRRGAVLGLTMAEVMLLLIFCLVFVVALIVTSNKEAQLTEIPHEWEYLGDYKWLVNRMTELREESSSIKDDWLELQKNSDLKDQIIADLQEQLREKESQIALLEANQETPDNWEELEREIKLKQVQIEELEQQLQTQKDIIEKQTVNLEQKDTEIEDLKSQLASKDSDISAIEEEKSKELDEKLKEKNNEISDLKSELASKDSNISAIEAELKKHSWPPIINLSDATKKHLFTVGKAELTGDFRKELDNNIAKILAGRAKEYNATVVEVIGHTDEQAVSNTHTNLDDELIKCFKEKCELQFADNVGLGMARAVRVAKVLMDNKLLEDLTIIPLSGGQLIKPSDELSFGEPGDDRLRRRIEIRVRRQHTIEN